jgi:hypothetical protein
MAQSIDTEFLEIYKSTVDYCKSNNIKDYELKIPLISYINRDNFIKFLKDESSTQKSDINNVVTIVNS